MSQKDGEEHPQQQQSDITSLQENFSKQQKKISALKELVKKSEAAHGKSTYSTQEKVKNIALRLTNLKSKARSRQNLDSSTTSLNDTQYLSQENLHHQLSQCSTSTDAGGGDQHETPHRPASVRIETPGSEKILLLRRQMEENKVKLAEREHSKREIEHMVTQLKAKFDTTQQCLEHSSELGRSMGDLSALSYSAVKDKVRSATDLASAPFNLDKERIKFLDNRVRLLEKQLEKEKSTSDASKRVKELENKVLELEEDLRQKRTTNLGDPNVDESLQLEYSLKLELEEKSKRILHLEEVNEILQNAKCDLTTRNQQLEEELEKLRSSLDLQKFELVDTNEEDRQIEQSLHIQHLEARVIKLQQENDELRQQKDETESQQDIFQETKQEDKAEETENAEETEESLEATIEAQRVDIQKHLERIKAVEDELMEKTIELNVLNANFAVLEEKLKEGSNPKPLFATASEGDVTSLKDQLEEERKKFKNLEKQLNEFKRMSDLHATVAELTEENEELLQKITELEDEKGQLQLKLVSGESTTIVTEIEIEKKIEYLEATCQNQTSAIQLLEEQKLDMTENLQSTKSELESARVVSEMESIQLEEQVNTNLQKIQELQRENRNLSKAVENLTQEKDSLSKKMEHYVAENMELLDKIEKLSKSSSSAESIEIVERLTQQDHLEIEAFNKRAEQQTNLTAEGGPEIDQELSESLVKLKEESSELMHKIELFTTERKEVLEKMETLTAENHDHVKKIKQLTDEKEELERSVDEANTQREALQIRFDHAIKEHENIKKEIKDISIEKSKITAELNNMVRAASIAAPTDAKDLLDKCEKSLTKLNTELENYRKANGQNAKFNASKKLSKEAKNVHQQMLELLNKVKSAPAMPPIPVQDDSKLEELYSVIETFRQELADARTAGEQKDEQITRLNEELNSLRSMSEEFDRLINDKEMAHEKQVENLTRLRRELEGKLETAEAEMKIFQDLIAEQKQQLIEAYTDSEREVGKKINELNERDEQISQLKSELQSLQANTKQVSQQFSSDLQLEVEKLREALSINKALLAEQIDELTNKQETIDTLNAQIMELYKTMEENNNKVIEKEDEIVLLHEQLELNRFELEKLTKENEENKQVVDKLLLELHAQKANLERLVRLEFVEEENIKLKEENQNLEENLQIAELKSSQLEQTVKDLEHRNKDQLEKLKKYAANLKKKVAQCQEFETKIKDLEKGVIDAEAKEKNPLIEVLEEQIRSKTVELQRTAHELESVQAAANQQRNHLEKSIAKVKEALGGVQLEMTVLREQLHEKTTHVEELTQAMNERDQALRESANELLILRENETKALELNTGFVSHSSAQDEVRALQSLLDEKNATIDALNQQYMKAESIQNDTFVLREQLNEKSTAIVELNQQIHSLNEQLSQDNQMLGELTALREAVSAKDKEIEKQNKILDSTEEQLIALQEEVNQKNLQIHMLNEQLHQLQSTAAHASPLQEQLQVRDLKIEELTNDIKARSLKFEKSKAVIKEKNRIIQRLNELLNKQVEEEQITPTAAPKLATVQPPDTTLLSELNELRTENAKLRDDANAERANFQETISRLETLHDGIQAKLQEDMSYIESLEQENNNFRDKICKLEECVATFEDRRALMECRANLLDAQLQTRVDEHTKTEDELVYRLNMLSEHDDIIGQRLVEAQEELEILSNKLETVKRENATLTTNYSKLEKEFAAFKEDTANNMDAENQSLKTQLAALDTEMKRLRATYEAKLAAKHSEIDELENDLSDQLRVISDEKRALTEDLEKARDEINELRDEHVRLNETINSLEQAKADLERESTWIKMQNDSLTQDQFELQEHRMQSMQDKTEIENLKHQIDTLAHNHDIELNALRTQIAELDSMRMQVGQNQTDDQVFIETENKRLTDLLAEKEALIENYQRQNLQLQMNALTARQQPVDPFASLTQSDDSAQVANLREKCDRLERELTEKQREIERLQLQQPQQQQLVPPPIAFFGAEQAAPSVFDEIVTVRHVDNLHGPIHSRSINHPPPPSLLEEAPGNQQTIEDLQRNVSDLEKHAHDLENKLAHRIVAHEDCLRQLEEIQRISETRFKEYEDRIRELELKQSTSTIESQILSAEQVPSLDMFFRGPVEASPFENIVIPPVSNEPVVEDVIVPKKAYICHPTEQQIDLDEGWGWGSEEAALEAKHFAATSSSTSLIPPQHQLEMKLQESQDRIQELQLERDRLEQQKQEMQVKSGKLMKKLKEYKAKIDELHAHASFRKSSSVESNELDLAIQEEMRSQLKQLEEKLAESKKAADNYSLEKDNLLKRIDTLTAGNERMTEMKERQDNDVLMYQSRIRELTQKIKSLEEWGAANEPAPTIAQVVPAIQTPPAAVEDLQVSKQLWEKKIQDLTSEMDDILGDRNELQALLDEERVNVQRAESTIKSLHEKITRLENAAGSDTADMKFQLNELRIENQNLKTQLEEAREDVAREKNERLQEINGLAMQSEELCSEIAKLQVDSVKAKELEVKLQEVSAEKLDLIGELEALRMELSMPAAGNKELEQRIVQLTTDFESVLMLNQELGKEIEKLKAEAKPAEDLDALRNELSRVTIELQSVNEINQKLQWEMSLAASQPQANIDVDLLQSELQEVKQRNEELNAEINKIRLESAFTPKPNASFADVERTSSEMNRLSSELQSIISEKERLVKELEALRPLESEIARLTAENQSLTAQIARLQLESSNSSSTSTQLTELEEQIQEKDSEIMHLKHRIEDLMREDQTEKLVLEILTKNQEIHMLKMQVKNLEDDKQELQHNLSLQITQEMNTKRADEVDSAAKLKELQTELDNLRSEKAHMEEELQVLNNHVLSSLDHEDKLKSAALELDTKNIEIAELRKSLETLKSNQSSQSTPSTEVEAINAKWETEVERRCAEIATMWRQHVDTRELEFNETINKLQKEIDSAKAIPSQQSNPDEDRSSSVTSSKDVSPDREDIQRMQEALESQEIEIVTLKEQLAIRSAEYAKLAAQYDPYKMQTTMSHSSGFGSDTQRRSDTSGSTVPKSELDLALYMLHQRDMRCEELTLELVHLLEERDELQLKLSNTLRQVEAIRMQGGPLTVESLKGDLSLPPKTPEKIAVTTAAVATETDDLNQKLSQLHSVNHNKDKRLQEERDQRIRQMEKIQQDVAKMPSEALSELVGSDLSQSNQSPSSVLLNWLWGKPTGGQS